MGSIIEGELASWEGRGGGGSLSYLVNDMQNLKATDY